MALVRPVHQVGGFPDLDVFGSFVLRRGEIAVDDFQIRGEHVELVAVMRTHDERVAQTLFPEGRGEDRLGFAFGIGVEVVPVERVVAFRGCDAHLLAFAVLAGEIDPYIGFIGILRGGHRLDGHAEILGEGLLAVFHGRGEHDRRVLRAGGGPADGDGVVGAGHALRGFAGDLGIGGSPVFHGPADGGAIGPFGRHGEVGAHVGGVVDFNGGQIGFHGFLVAQRLRHIHFESSGDRRWRRVDAGVGVQRRGKRHLFILLCGRRDFGGAVGIDADDVVVAGRPDDLGVVGGGFDLEIGCRRRRHAQRVDLAVQQVVDAIRVQQRHDLGLAERRVIQRIGFDRSVEQQITHAGIGGVADGVPVLRLELVGKRIERSLADHASVDVDGGLFGVAVDGDGEQTVLFRGQVLGSAEIVFVGTVAVGRDGGVQAVMRGDGPVPLVAASGATEREHVAPFGIGDRRRGVLHHHGDGGRPLAFQQTVRQPHIFVAVHLQCAVRVCAGLVRVVGAFDLGRAEGRSLHRVGDGAGAVIAAEIIIDQRRGNRYRSRDGALLRILRERLGRADANRQHRRRDGDGSHDTASPSSDSCIHACSSSSLESSLITERCRVPRFAPRGASVRPITLDLGQTEPRAPLMLTASSRDTINGDFCEKPTASL